MSHSYRIMPLFTIFPAFRLQVLRTIVAAVSNVMMSLLYLQTLHCDQLSQGAITFVAWHPSPSLTELDISVPSGHPFN
jgi:hypothetical protein